MNLANKTQLSTKRRIEFIDYVRGVAALMVMFEHSLESSGIVQLGTGKFGSTVVNFGETGVVAFFLVSGYVIPFTLEKKGSLSQFWVSRAFRIYPMYLFAFAIGCFSIFDFYGVHDGILKNLLAHIFFVQEYVLRDHGNIVPALWFASTGFQVMLEDPIFRYTA